MSRGVAAGVGERRRGPAVLRREEVAGGVDGVAAGLDHRALLVEQRVVEVPLGELRLAVAARAGWGCRCVLPGRRVTSLQQADAPAVGHAVDVMVPCLVLVRVDDAVAGGHHHQRGWLWAVVLRPRLPAAGLQAALGAGGETVLCTSICLALKSQAIWLPLRSVSTVRLTIGSEGLSRLVGRPLLW